MIATQINQLIHNAIKKAQKKGDLPKFDIPEIIIERPKDSANGDFATPAALGLARYARMAPVQIAEKIIKRIEPTEYIGEVTVAHPGLINLRLSESWLAQQVETVLSEADEFGRINIGSGTNVQVEFISANPTGPLVVGKERGGVDQDSDIQCRDRQQGGQRSQGPFPGPGFSIRFYR